MPGSFGGSLGGGSMGFSGAGSNRPPPPHKMPPDKIGGDGARKIGTSGLDGSRPRTKPRRVSRAARCGFRLPVSGTIGAGSSAVVGLGAVSPGTFLKSVSLYIVDDNTLSPEVGYVTLWFAFCSKVPATLAHLQNAHLLVDAAGVDLPVIGSGGAYMLPIGAEGGGDFPFFCMGITNNCATAIHGSAWVWADEQGWQPLLGGDNIVSSDQ